MKRSLVRPELWLPWLTFLGFGSYVVSWAGREAFYQQFGITSEIVGVDYPTLLVPAAVVGAVTMLLVAAIAALVSPVLKRWSRQSALLQIRVGGLVALATCGILLLISMLHRSLLDRGPTLLLGVPFWFGALLFAQGESALMDTRIRRRQMRRLRRKMPAKEAMPAYIKERRDWRHRRQARRAKRTRVASSLLPAAVPLLVTIVIVLYIAFAGYLVNAAEHAARNIILDKTDAFSSADLPASVLLNVHARSVHIVAVASQFRALEKTRLVYLGTSSGTHVLYNRTAHQTILVPSGSVALRFD